MLATANNFMLDLKAKGLAFTQKEEADGSVLIKIPYKKQNINVKFYGKGGSKLMIISYFGETELAFPQKKLNKFNNDYDLIKFYSTEDGNIFAEINAIVTADTAAEIGLELLIRFVTITDELESEIATLF